MKKLIAGLTFLLAFLAVPLLSAQENALDWNSPRLMALGMSTAGTESPYGSTINPAASAANQRMTLDLSYFIIPTFDGESNPGHWANVGVSLPSNIGVFDVSARFATSPLTKLNFGTFGGLNVSFAKDVLDNLYFGAGLGFQISPTDWGLGLDVGFIHMVKDTGFLKDFRWGVAVRGLGKAMSTNYTLMPPNFTPAIGTQFKLIKSESFDLGVNADFAFPVFQNVQANVGVDMVIAKIFNIQVSYDIDLKQMLAGNGRYIPVSVGFGFNFKGGSDTKPSEDGKPAPFWSSNEYNPSLVVAPITDKIWAIGVGLNMPIGNIDRSPPKIELGDPVFDDPKDSGLEPPTAPATTQINTDKSQASAPEATGVFEATSSASFNDVLPVGSGAPEKPVGGSGQGGDIKSTEEGARSFISPNLDGIRDNLTLPVRISDERQIASYSLIIMNESGATIRAIRNKETRPETADLGTMWDRLVRVKEGLKVPRSLVWDGRGDDSNVVPDGTYTYIIEVADDNGNTSRSSARTVVVDTKAAELKAEAPITAFAPGGDRPVLVINLQSSESLAPVDVWKGSILDSSGKPVRTWEWKGSLPPQTIWDGKNDAGVLAADGIYSFKLNTSDRSGNRSAAEVSNLLLLNQQTPVILSLDNAWFSPNGDGMKDSVTVTIDANKDVKVEKWTAKLINSKGQTVRTFTGTETLPKTIFIEGKTEDGKVLVEDSYKLSLTALYVNGNNPTSDSPVMVLDLTKPQISIEPEFRVFSPNGDGFKDVLAFNQKASIEPQWEAQIFAADGKTIRSYAWRGQPDEKLVWDGRDDRNEIVGDGDYTYQAKATDLAGNIGISNPVVIKVDDRATSVSIRAARVAFAPGTASKFKVQDLSLSQNLSDDIESWQVRILSAKSSNDAVVQTWTGKGTPAATLAWDGKQRDGKQAPDAAYIAEYQLTYDKGDKPRAVTAPFNLDTQIPTVKLSADNPYFSPDGDGKQDIITFAQITSDEEMWTATVSDPKDRIIRSLTWSGKTPDSWVWDGTDNAGNKVADGEYKYDLSAVDAAGNSASARVSPIKIQTVKPEISLNVGSLAFSPNSDGVKDTMEFTPVLKITTDVKTWKLQINPANGGSARTASGTESVPAKLLWDGKTDGGRFAPEGDYIATLSVEYKSGQTPSAQSAKFALDITPPSATTFADPTLFSPNGDSQKDIATITQDVSREESWVGTIRFAVPPTAGADTLVKSWTWVGKAPKTLTWDGANSQGITVPDGRYVYQVSATDLAGNSANSAPIEVKVDNRATPIAIKANQRWFSPNLDGKQDKLLLTPSIGLSEGIENWQIEIRTAVGSTVRSIKASGASPAAVEWDGKTDAGVLAPDGDYVAAFTVSYLKGNKPQVKTEIFSLDTKSPEIKLATDETLFSPDGDGLKDVVKIKQTSSSEELWEGVIQNAAGATVRSYFWKGNAIEFAWDGRDENGNRQPDGIYKYAISATDKAGNATRQELKGMVIDTRATPLLLLTSTKGFAPGTARAGLTTIAFQPMLTLTGPDMVVGYNIAFINQTEKNKVERVISGTGVPPTTIVWDGLREDKTIASEGKYEAVLTVEYRKGNKPEAHSPTFILDVSAPLAQLGIAPKPFSPDDDGVDDEATIGIAVEDLSPIKDWSLEIQDPQGAHFVTFSGQGTPTSRIVWNGRSDTGELVQAAVDYTAVLTVTDNLGNKGTYKDNIPVDVLVIRDGDLLRIRIPGINFPANSPDLGSDKLKPEQLTQNSKTLDRLAEILKKYGSYSITVEGHANITQYWDQKLADVENTKELQPLSEKRAAAVKSALVKRGISDARMNTKGMGGSKPVVPNNDLPNVWKNRRVEFILQK